MPYLAVLLALLFLMPVPAVASAEREVLAHVEKRQWGKVENVLPLVRDPLIRDVAIWYELAQNDQVSRFDEYAAFLKRRPGWPQEEKLLTRAEVALLNDPTRLVQAEQWFAAHPPRTERGKFFLEERRSRGKPSAAAVKQAWISADLPEPEEKRFLIQYRSQLTMADHIARTDRLLWEGQLSAATRMLLRVPEEESRMFEARMALMKRKGNFDGLLNRVPARLKNAPGLLFERIRFRFDKKIYDSVSELLRIAPANPPYPAKWWPYRRYMIREELDKGRYAQALALAKPHGQKDKVELSEALWMKAWIELSFLKQATPAIADFTRLYDTVEYPISKSRGAYWVAKAEQAAGNRQKAREWLMRAADHPTTFYGQLAFEEMYGNQPLVLPKASATITDAEWQQMLPSHSLAQAVMATQRQGFDNLALPLLMHLSISAKTPKLAAFAAHTGWKTGRADFAVRSAKEALNKNYYLPDYLFPLDMTPPKLALEPALAYAIARQESMFYPRARSSADARGMMQILPNTGRLVASKHGLGFTPERLWEQDYNFILGSLYLNDLLSKFGGAKIMAIAGYNAGPGRPASWAQRYGALTSSPERNVDWIERIPFSETRNYVQRVLENYQVYRLLLSDRKAAVNARASILP